MLLLTSYMDETGHPDDPVLHFCGMAGFVAPLEKWQEFEKYWQPTLDSYNLLEPFHMKDFAHSEGEFKGWKGNETKRREFGATQTVPFRFEQAGTAEQLWHHIREGTDYGKWMGEYATSTPRETVRLQAADIFAYELSKDFENQIQRPELPMRWGLKQILKMSDIPLPMIQLSRRKQLLKIIKKNGWVENAGVEELSSIVEEETSTMAGRIQWTKERGKWDDPPDEI